MYQLFFTPSWFNGYDLVFEGISLVVALLIAAYSWKIYRMSHENRYGYFSLAFILIGVSLAIKMFTYGVLYFEPLREGVATALTPVVGTGLQFADLFYRAAFFLQMAGLLGAWMLVFFISQKSRERLHSYYEVSQIALFLYLILLICFVSNFQYTVFYLTSAVILGLTVLNYYKNYLNSKSNNKAFLVMIAFLFVLLSNISFIFVFLWESMYVAGEVFLLIGFLLLLYTYRQVRRS